MQILTFFLKSEKHAIDISLVETIESKNTITTVPKAPKSVVGLMSNRGNVIAVINTAMILGKKDQELFLDKFIVLNVNKEQIALAVSDIDDVFDIDESMIERINNEEKKSVINIDNNVINFITLNQLKEIYQ